jgi:hypothetical protein
MTRLSAFLGSLVLVLGTSVKVEGDSAGASYACASRPDIVGPCFELRGRLSFWNGAPSARIWPVGTKRMLGVHSDILPPELETKMMSFDPQRFDTEAWAHFMVCPLTHYRAGPMQFVCIESWHNLSFDRRRP